MDPYGHPKGAGGIEILVPGLGRVFEGKGRPPLRVVIVEERRRQHALVCQYLLQLSCGKQRIIGMRNYQAHGPQGNRGK